jgi:hypothetical protein
MNNRFAIVENNLVTNVVIADEEYANQQGWISCTIAGPGWSYVDGVFTAPVEQTTHETPTPTKEELLQQITALQQQIESLV